MDRNMVEELILGMADIVCENRNLRKENEYLKNEKIKYENMIKENLEASNKIVNDILTSKLNDILEFENNKGRF